MMIFFKKDITETIKNGRTGTGTDEKVTYELKKSAGVVINFIGAIISTIAALGIIYLTFVGAKNQDMIMRITVLAVAVVLLMQATAGMMTFFKKEYKETILKIDDKDEKAEIVVKPKKVAGSYVNLAGSIIQAIGGLGVLYYGLMM